ncbi:MAG: exodeoxyribonuclease V subunit gamma [Spirochaetes bacterium]|jgi:exodeoxyribonuclease V gamma subunit|nr:exodeoxyribonuclease V subunit gamma [Spirochaetota bacterium]
MPLYLYQSNRIENIIPPLAEALQSHSSDENLLATDYCLVQSIGMGRYFALELAGCSSIFANYRMVYPNAFLQLLASHHGIRDQVATKEQIGWKIFSLMKSGSVSHPALEHYCDGSDDLKLFTSAYALADIFDQYAMYRPTMVQAWDEGHAIKIDKGQTGSLDVQDEWQYILWRQIFDGTMNHKASFQKEVIASISSISDLPFKRLFILGVSTIPLFFLEVIHHISQFCNIHVGLLAPSGDYWEDIVNKKYRFFTALNQQASVDISDYFFTGNTILGSNGMLGRDFNQILSDYFGDELGIDRGDFFEDEPDTILGNIQRDIRELNDRGIFGDKEGAKFIRHESDRSLQIHGVHSKRRELEILHDTLLDILNNDSSVELRDILVMTPAINDYAPYIQAVFNEFRGSESFLDFSIADLSLATDSETVPAFLKIIALYRTRFTCSQIVSLLRYRPLTEKAGIPEDEIERVGFWLHEASFCWGRNAEDRKKLLNVSYDEYSLSFALTRLLHGYLFPRNYDQTFEDVFPSGDFEGEQAILMGKLIAFVSRIEQFTHSCEELRSCSGWESLLHDLVHDLFSDNDNYAESREMLFSSISRCTSASDSICSDEVPFEIIAHLLDTQLTTESRAFGFIDGRITFCEMLPMRSIPFKVIAIIGFNESDFPRAAMRNSYDLIHRYPRTGDRSTRYDDRYLFLETLLSARKFLYFSFQAYKESDNSRLFPSPLISELLHYLEENCENFNAAEFILYHKLQPFSADYVATRKTNSSEKDSSDYFTYDKRQPHRAQIYYKSKKNKSVFISDSITSEPESASFHLTLTSLKRFFQNSSRFFMQQRLGIRFTISSDEYENSEPYQMSKGTRRSLILTMVEEIISDKKIKSDKKTLRMNAILPLFAPGDAEYSSITAEAHDLYDRLSSETNVTTFSNCDARFSTDGKESTDTTRSVLVTGIFDLVNSDGHFVLFPSPRKQADREIAGWWLEHLLFQFSDADCRRSTILLSDTKITFEQLDRDVATLFLKGIISLYEDGLYYPLRFDSADSYMLYRESLDSDKDISDILETIKYKSGARYGTDTIYNDYIKKTQQYRQICFPDSDIFYSQQFTECSLRFFKGINGYFSELMEVENV